VAEAVRDTATALEELGAWLGPSPNVLALSGDGGALSIGLRSLLHTIHRRARITIVILINEVFANTGFQYSPTALPYADSSTAPHGLPADPMDHIGLALTAGAAFVAQASPAFPPFFAEVVEEALACPETAVVFVPSPCIAGWKFEEGMTAELGKLASQTGLFPCFRKRRGQVGELKHVPEKSRRPPVQRYLAHQRRFEHVAHVEGNEAIVTAGHQAELSALQAYADRNVARLERLAAQP
jgi:pyruvate ferredoxin oxidoreductase beta subunit